MRRGAIANMVLGLLKLKAPHEKFFGINQASFRKEWHRACRTLGMPWAPPPHGLRHSGPSEDIARGRATLEQVRRRGRWRALSSVQRYSKTFAVTQFRARMPQKILDSGAAAGRDLRGAVQEALGRAKPSPASGAMLDGLKGNKAGDIAAELLHWKGQKALPKKKASRGKAKSDDDSLDDLYSDDTFGEATGWWTE